MMVGAASICTVTPGTGGTWATTLVYRFANRVQDGALLGGPGGIFYGLNVDFGPLGRTGQIYAITPERALWRRSEPAGLQLDDAHKHAAARVERQRLEAKARVKCPHPVIQRVGEHAKAADIVGQPHRQRQCEVQQ